MTNKFKQKKEIRPAVSALMDSLGCSCCRNEAEYQEAKKVLAELLGFPKYKDGSGYDFSYSFKPNKKKK